MGLEIGLHCTPTSEGPWLCFLCTFCVVVKISSPQILISDLHLSSMCVSPVAADPHSAPAYLCFALVGFLLFRNLCQLLIALDS